MRTIKNYMAYLAIFLLLFSSCTKDETVPGNGEVSDDVASLYLGPVLENLANQSRQQEQDVPECSTDDPAYAQIRLTYGESNTPVEVVVDILQDDQGLFTAYDDALEIPIPSGETTVSVTLTDFVVWNDVDGAPGVPIWVAPKEGSEYAQFVSDPLSNTFTLRAGSKNYVNVDVICYDDRDVNLYGYLFFDINPIPLYEFCVFANFCISEGGRDYVANYSFDLYAYSGEEAEDNPVTDESLYTSIYMDKMPVTGLDGETYYADPLCLPIPAGDSENPDAPYLYYEITLEDWDGYYGEAPDVTQSGYLSWNQVQALLDEDGDDSTVDYMHFFLNCPGGGDPTCEIDTDQDGVPDCDDICPGFDDTIDTDEDGVPDGCDECAEGDDNIDTDEDGYADACDNCPQASNQDQADSDGDGVGDACDECVDEFGEPDFFGCPNDPCIDQPDPDGDGVRGICDNCPDVANADQADSDEDGVGDACDTCPDYDDTADEDGDGVPDGCDVCPGFDDNADVDADGVPDGCDVCEDGDDTVDTDGDGIPDDCENPDGEGACETAFMFGDTPINTFNNVNRWGWAELFDDADGTSQTFKIWAGAGQNDTSKGTHVGDATVTLNGDGDVELDIDIFSGYSFDELHVNLSEDQPSGNTAKAPGQYNRNGEVSADVTEYTFDFNNTDGDFWIIVHAVTCGIEED
ncbi:hypothetical protein G3I01_10885 [Gramella sp. MT6]|uniref:thrombospondin type 3 repeat-containing protein n=1 Tax=Gramella sp. MT6 TaxID=2705471 RepID=UPI001C5F4B9D|nr:thrombospondin type 3 repeat-containing protein [Gramella sp. MT6]QYA25997.1 hypothetical protein G3I01_10885 [Gramella sp. MT6]